MKHKWILAVIICVAVVAVGIFYFDKGGIDITGAIPSGPIDLKTFNYSAVEDKEDFPRVNVTGVIDNICSYPNLHLWSKLGGKEAGGQISINVKGCPGTPMYVTEPPEQYGDTTWYHVQKYENRDGLQMYWDGWVPEEFILQGPLPVPVEKS